MSPDQALALIAGLLKVTMMVAGPILLASLMAGLAVGIVQTATQLNEASVSYVVKVLAVVGVIVAVGPAMAEQIVGYTRHSLEAVGSVVR